MKITRFILAPLMMLALAVPAQAAERLSLAEISAYLNTIETARGEFTQINADGTISTGTISIKRPGRVRFDYNPPEATMVMAGGGEVAIFDRKSNQPPERYPLSRTPLSLVLARNVDLTQARMVVGHTNDDTTTTVVAQDPENPEYGTIELVFTAAPVELRQWVIRDGGGSATTVVLGELATGMTIGDSTFSVLEEMRRAGFQ
ncbi:MAG: outer membrane lipoprotein carrier protein LolA [Paracoccaceae bacterium]